MEVNTTISHEEVDFSIETNKKLFQEQVDFARQLQIADNEGMYDRRNNVEPTVMPVGVETVIK